MRRRLFVGAGLSVLILAVESCTILTGLGNELRISTAPEAGVIVVRGDAEVIRGDAEVIHDEGGVIIEAPDAYVPPFTLACTNADGGWHLDCDFGDHGVVNVQLPASSAPVLGVTPDGGVLFSGSAPGDASVNDYLGAFNEDGSITSFTASHVGTPSDISIVPPFDSTNFSAYDCPLYATLDSVSIDGGPVLSLSLYSEPLKVNVTPRTDHSVNQEPVRLLSSSLMAPTPIATFLTNFDVEGGTVPGTTTINLYAAMGAEFSHVTFATTGADFGRASSGITVAPGTWVVGMQSDGGGSALYIPNGADGGAVQTFPSRFDDVVALSDGGVIAVGPADGGVMLQSLASDGDAAAAASFPSPRALTDGTLRMVAIDGKVVVLGVTPDGALAIFDGTTASFAFAPIGSRLTLGGAIAVGGHLYVGLEVPANTTTYAIVVRLSED